LVNLALLSLALFSGCAVTVPNTRFCAVAGIMEGGMDCFHTLSDEEDHIEPLAIKTFLEAQDALTDAQGKVVQSAHAAAICQPMEDWGLEHQALEQACTKLGAACSYDIQKMVNSVTAKVGHLGVTK
jgi:hypothetical protein